MHSFENEFEVIVIDDQYTNTENLLFLKCDSLIIDSHSLSIYLNTLKTIRVSFEEVEFTLKKDLQETNIYIGNMKK